MSGASEAPSKACHNCRRQRLRCDRSYPHCNKCTSLGKDCLGYGKLFRWTGSVASRGKLAGKPSSAAIHGQQDPVPAGTPSLAAASSLSGAIFVDGSPIAPYPSPATTDMQLAWPRSPSVESTFTSPHVLVDPLYQDLGASHRYYLSYCK